jgi:hypothetical protein
MTIKSPIKPIVAKSSLAQDVKLLEAKHAPVKAEIAKEAATIEKQLKEQKPNTNKQPVKENWDEDF